MQITRTFEVYCDESRQVGNDKYLLLGSIWVDNRFKNKIINEWSQYLARKYYNPPEHLKWTSTPSPKAYIFSAYLELCSLFFKYAEYDSIRFRMLITTKAEYNCAHKIYNNGDYEEGFYKLYYLLLHYFFENSYQYNIFLATRNVKNNEESFYISQLHEILQNANKNKCSIPTLKAILARESIFIQMADIFLGAVGYHYEGLHLKHKPRPGKVRLAKHIADHLGKEDLKFDTPIWERKFNIFRFSPYK